MNIEIYKPQIEEYPDASQERENVAAKPSRKMPVGGKTLVELFAESPLKRLALVLGRNKFGARPSTLNDEP